MKVLVDVNLSPSWTDVFQKHSIEAVHWTSIGNTRAKDSEILGWARENDYIVFTHDLDFTTILALSEASGPSVIQVRTQDVTPAHLEAIVIGALKEHTGALEAGCVVVIEESRSRVRLLPLTE